MTSAPISPSLPGFKVDPGYVFKPDVVAQLQALKDVDRPNYETLRAKLKRETKCHVGGTHFKQWLAVRHFEATGDTPSLDAFPDVESAGFDR